MYSDNFLVVFSSSWYIIDIEICKQIMLTLIG
jgi:hypothetical protein